MPFQAQDPNAQLFSFIPQARAQNLAQRTGDPTVDAINQIHLGMLERQGGGTQEYLKALAASNQLGADTTLEGARIDNAGKLDVALAGNLPNYIKAGAGRAVGNASPESQLALDRGEIANADANAMQNDIATRYQNLGAGAASAANAGIETPTNFIQGTVRGPNDTGNEMGFKGGYIKPIELKQLAIEQQDADSRRLNALKAPSGGDDNGKWKIEYGADGAEIGRTWQGSGDPPASNSRRNPNSKEQVIANAKKNNASVTVNGNTLIIRKGSATRTMTFDPQGNLVSVK
jgi:hypothetical protein